MTDKKRDVTVRIAQDRSIDTRVLRIGGVEKITPEVLVEVSELCLARYQACEDDNKLLWYVYHEHARNLEKNGNCPEEGVSILGSMLTEGVRVPAPGDQVVVRKGALVGSYHPDFEKGPRAMTRRQTVRVDHVIGGFIDPYESNRVVSPQIRWAGSGGYWRWVSPDQIEIPATETEEQSA